MEEVQLKYSSWYENIWISLFNYLPTLRRSSHWPKQANQETRDIRYAISKGCNRFFKDDLHSTKWHRFGSKKSKCSAWLCQVFNTYPVKLKMRKKPTTQTWPSHAALYTGHVVHVIYRTKWIIKTEDCFIVQNTDERVRGCRQALGLHGTDDEVIDPMSSCHFLWHHNRSYRVL